MVNAMLSAAHLRLLFCFAVAMLCAAAAQAQSGADVPDATIPLDGLGYQPPPAHILLMEGYAVSSLHYVDEHHLLFTYNARTLIKRMPDDSPDEAPQNVNALLMEIPSGKVLARTQWRLHDHGQYLWPVGEGAFLLRVGRELRLVTPLNESEPEKMLQGKLLTTLPGQVSGIEVSPDGRMLLVESDVVTHPAATNPTTPVDSPPAPDYHVTDLQFLEVDLSQQAQGVLHVKRVGHLTAPAAMQIPLIHDGYMHAQEIYPDDWGLVYTRLGGQETSVLGDVSSTCAPSIDFLSNKEMMVKTCNGNDTAVITTVITLDRKELWQKTLDDAGTDPTIRTTPASGRFAISRILINGVASPGADLLGQDDVRMQRIDVMDIQNGALVASVAAAPAERTAQNFALSADGRHLAVLQNQAIAIYDLAAPQDFPPPKVRPKDIVFDAAPEGTSVLPSMTIQSAAAAAPAPATLEVPLNVDARRAPPSLLTPEEKRSVEGKRNKQITLPPPVPPAKNQPPQQQQ
jgi:hypothetical protein